jgi:hypothetical protein
VAVPIEEMRKLVGVTFPGGTYTIAHWENVLMTDVMACEPLPDGIVHPACLFHVPIAGAGISIADIFVWAQAESDEAVRAGEYEWELRRPLREGETYTMRGGFTGVERKQGRRGGLMDVVTFRIELMGADGELAAAVTNSWIFLRSEAA